MSTFTTAAGQFAFRFANERKFAAFMTAATIDSLAERTVTMCFVRVCWRRREVILTKRSKSDKERKFRDEFVREGCNGVLRRSQGIWQWAV